MKKHTLTIAILFLWCFSVFPQEPVKFSTKQTRELWQICSESFRNLNPSMGPNIYYPVCDCYVDHIRNNYTSEQIMTNNSSSMGMTQEGYRRLSQELRDTCNPKKPKEENFT